MLNLNGVSVREDIQSLLRATRSTREIERKRAYFFADKALRVFTPIALRAAASVPSHAKELEKHALALEQLPELTETSAAAANAAANAAAATYAWRTTAADAVDAARRAAADAANAAVNEWDAEWDANIVETAGWAAIAAVWAADTVQAAVDADARWAGAARQAIVMKAIEIFRQAIAIS